LLITANGNAEEYVTHGYLPLLVTNRLAREEIVRVLEQKPFSGN